jgi:hypothetical protein
VEIHPSSLQPLDERGRGGADHAALGHWLADHIGLESASLSRCEDCLRGTSRCQPRQALEAFPSIGIRSSVWCCRPSARPASRGTTADPLDGGRPRGGWGSRLRKPWRQFIILVWAGQETGGPGGEPSEGNTSDQTLGFSIRLDKRPPRASRHAVVDPIAAHAACHRANAADAVRSSQDWASCDPPFRRALGAACRAEGDHRDAVGRALVGGVNGPAWYSRLI